MASTYKVEELLYRNARTQTYRARHRSSGEKVLIHVPAAGKGPVVLRREQELLTRLGHKPESIHPREADLDAAMAVVTSDPGGVVLKPLLGSGLDRETVMALTKSLAEAIEHAHSHGVVLRDVTPHNLLVDLTARTVNFISYGVASRVARQRSRAEGSDILDAALPYISPEQTGRMNREVDYRTDFYSLGVTLYELTTGELPFTGTDAVELVHAHIARTPAPPHSKSRSVPRGASDMILKLLAKNAEDRYRTASGILRDLARVEAQLDAGSDESFVLGRDDRSDQFLIPQELYGREPELAEIFESFERVVDGMPELLIVSGYSGIGKTALVYELHRPTVVRRGLFAAGKFEMLAQTVPYSGFVSAFRDLVLQLLTENESSVATYKRAFEDTLGDQAGVLVELLPELELLIGPQPPVPTFAAGMAERRLRSLLTRFVQVFTASQRPLVVFLDDLQWADSASMRLLSHLARTGESRSLLLIGAYRDNEVGPKHPLTLALDDLRDSEVSLSELRLTPLPPESVDELVADTLHEDSERVAKLAILLRDKTGGNPFFLRQFFSSLHESGALWWSTTNDPPGWTWDIEELRAKEHTENVVDLMVGKLRKLAEKTQRVLEYGACVGSRFEASVLGEIMNRSLDEIVDALYEAVQLGLVYSGETSERDANYRFVHDRVQEAAYSLIDEDGRQRAHLRIGRLLWTRTPTESIEEELFDICRHFNLCIDLLDDVDERRNIASLELAAGRQAKASTAYEAACSYLAAGLELAGGDGAWERGYELTFALHRELAESEYLAGDPEAADRHFDEILERAKTDLARVELYKLKAALAYNTNKYPEALAATVAGLAELGQEFPDVSDSAALDALAATEGATLAGLLEDHSISELIDLPEMVEPHALAEADLFNELSLIGMFYNPQLASIGALKRANLSITKGNSRVSGPAYGAHGMIVGSALGDYAAGYELGRVGLELSRRQGDRRAECQAGFWFAAFSNHWRAPLADSLSTLKSGVEHGLRIGTPSWAAFNAFFVPVHTLVSGARLDEVDEVAARYLPVMDPVAVAGNRGYLQLVRSLTGRTPDAGTLGDAEFDPATFIAEYSEPGKVLALKHYYVAALAGLAFFGRMDEAVVLAEQSLETGDPAVVLFGQVVNAWWLFFQGVALCDVLASPPKDMDEALVKQRTATADACIERLEHFATNAPSNYEPMRLLLEAEHSRLEGEQLDAMNGYDQAVAAAREHELVHIEAFANERAGRFHLEQGRDKVAKGYFREATNRYAMWGATAKVDQLHAEFPDAIDEAQSDADADSNRDPRGIDLTSVLKSSRVLTSEIDLQRLLETTLTIVLENAGAERGVLLIVNDDELRVEASGRLDGPRADIQTFPDAPLPIEEAEDIPVCVSIAQYVARTRDTMVLDDAHERGRMVQNPYIADNKVRSVICTPLINQGRLFGLIYLENNLVAGAFTPGRVETLKLIASHSVIAIQNARLYANLNRYSQELERLNKSMSRFVPREFLSTLGKDTLTEVGLGLSVSKEMSILFSDIRGFTTLIETLPEGQHIEFINEYLQYMEPPIATNRGFVDSYIGDAIMALFNNSPDQAIQAAVDMSAELRELNGKRAARGEAPVNMGVGINTGPLTLGTIGGPTRIKCGVIGESVNLAARIQDLTKRYHAFLLVGDSTVDRLDDPERYVYRVVGRVTVAGSARPTTLYEILDAELRLHVRDAKLATLADYERGVEAFYDRRFDEAAALFDACIRACPQDTPAKLYKAAAEEFARIGVAADWDGVAHLKTK